MFRIYSHRQSIAADQIRQSRLGASNTKSHSNSYATSNDHINRINSDAIGQTAQTDVCFGLLAERTWRSSGCISAYDPKRTVGLVSV